MSNHRYFIVNKPFQMLSQFTGTESLPMLGELDYDFPEGTHCIGRLDSTSEGLLVLTTNKQVTRLLFDSQTPHQRQYLVQVYKHVSPATLHQLRTGVPIPISGALHYITEPCEVSIVEKPTDLFESGWSYPDDRPHTWLLISLTEGKFRQIRKMLKAVRHHCQRLIRVAIEDLTLGDLQPGQVREIPEAEFFAKLRIPYPHS
ncbi:pseudouridine synthase [Siphonobacter sp. BAB-5385]|uniref:pseudouridine synthase n=1 Tax=unclassified Siphonobacter TaxID=2635712 RepID=UPI000B9E895C|nr:MULTISPECIES: pseudouridine synthase [unclassified Siphonobacter]OZI06028.1 pseudouridine synthase [Siphonobacter sp. BAB-5385]PMD97307.1 pseudouridine synthase [Siphonobacter sp. BAB-5405]